MKTITSENKALAEKIAFIAFKHIAAVNSLVKNDHKKPERLKVLFNFCISVAMEKEGAFLTTDERGVALLFKSWKKLSLSKTITYYFKLINSGIGWVKTPKMLWREYQIQKRRKKDKHLYFWLLGFDNEIRDIARIKEIRDFCFGYSKAEELPIVAEATSQSALNMYTRYGFVVYDTYSPGGNQPTTYFIVRDWRH